MTAAITQFGALGVFLLMVPEAACIPVPSEATLVFAGIAVRQGWMSFPLAVGAATGGNLVGSGLAYALGASHLVGRVPIARNVLERWREMLERHGVRAVLFARLLPLARTFVSLPAGANGIALVPFTVYTLIGSALWAAGFVLLGVVFAGAWGALDSLLGRGLVIAGIVVGAIAIHQGKRKAGSEARE